MKTVNFDEPIPYMNYRLNGVQRISKKELEDGRLYWICFDHISGKRTFRDEYNLILEKKSTLPSACRNFIIKQSKEWLSEEK